MITNKETYLFEAGDTAKAIKKNVKGIVSVAPAYSTYRCLYYYDKKEKKFFHYGTYEFKELVYVRMLLIEKM